MFGKSCHTPAVIPGRPQGEPGIHTPGHLCGAGRLRHRAPHLGLWLWIPGSRFARPGMTARGGGVASRRAAPQIEKLVPQPQEAVAFGLFTRNEAPDQVVDEIDLRAGQERHRGRIDQHHGGIALDHQIVLGLGALDVEFVLEAGAAAALDAESAAWRRRPRS